MPDINWTQLREKFLQGFSLASLPPNVALPALPLAVTRFIERSRDERATMKELATIVETDTGLTAELLRHVNSSYVGLREKAKTVHQALSVLGLRQSKLFIITKGTQAAVLARRSRLLNQACFWNSCLQKALFAREVAKLLKTDPDVAFSGALLQDYLLPVVTNDLYEAYARFTERRTELAECVTTYEDAHFRWNHATAGACLAVRWKLPDELVCCILFHHRGLHILADPLLGRSPVAAVAISALLPDQLRQSLYGLQQLVFLQQKWPGFDLQTIIELVDNEHAELNMGVENAYPLSRWCQPALTSKAAC